MLSRPMVNRISVFGISWYAFLIVTAVLIGFAYCSREARRLRIQGDVIIDFFLCGIPLGVVFARLYYVLFRFNVYSESLLSILNIRAGGLAIYGGIIGGLLAARIISKKYNMSIWTILDIVAPALILGQAIGRWGNYINMEAYGLRISDVRLQFFPLAVEIPVGNIWYWHLATFFYEFCWDVLVFFALLFLKNRQRQKGDCFCWYLLLYCAGRTVIEGLRFDSLTFISEFVRISQVLSALASLGVVIYFFLRIRDRFCVATFSVIGSSVLCIITTFLGEFERGAYSTLFHYSQISLLLLILSSLITVALWTMDCGFFDWKTVLPLCIHSVVILFALLLGSSRLNADNTYYVSLRQSVAMLQLILNGWILCYPLHQDIQKAR